MQQTARPIRKKEPAAGAQTKKLDLKLKVKNFGPVYEGDIHLKPLTLFVGPNNSGKSYIAMLVHSIFEANPAGREQKSFYRPALHWVAPDASESYNDILE